VATLVTSTSPVFVGGMTIPWGDFRELLPDDRWAVWAAGWAQSAVGFTLQIAYQQNDTSRVVLGQQNYGAQPTFVKIKLGPFAARGVLAPAGAWQGEYIQSINLAAAVASAGQLNLRRWTLWLRMSPAST
jgi:hypothetical protein